MPIETEPAATQPAETGLTRTHLLRALALFPLYIVLIGLVTVLWDRPWVLTGCCAVLAAAMLWRWHTRSDVLFFVLCALLGPGGEWVAIRGGAWTYTEAGSVLSLIPIWLPLGWAIAGLYLKKTVEVLVPGVGAGRV